MNPSRRPDISGRGISKSPLNTFSFLSFRLVRNRSKRRAHRAERSFIRHSGLSGIFLVIPNKSKDSRQAGMTLKINIQFPDTLRSLPQGSSRTKRRAHRAERSFIRHSGLSGIFLVMPNKSKDSRQAGMTLKINIQFPDTLRSLPQGSSRTPVFSVILNSVQNLVFSILNRHLNTEVI